MGEHCNVIRGDVQQLRADTYASVNSIDHLAQPVSYGEFFRSYLLPNRACLLGSWATAGWRSRNEWVTSDGKPNLDIFQEKFGAVECCVANCGQEEYNTHPKSDMTVDAYIEYIRCYQQQGYPANMDCLYLKDWHFTKLFPDYDAYSVPMYFASDWMNEYWDSRSEEVDDYRFVYFGPKGSWTPFHSDVLRSYSWSANIVGCKKWIFFPPGEEEHLKDSLGNLVYNLDSLELEEGKKFPHRDKVRKRFEVIQNAGEVIFVPSGWHHQVYNMEDTISINHNWLNGCNIDLSWEHVKQALQDVQREISDVRDMEGWGDQCQLVLKCSSGIDYKDFYEFMLNIATWRLECLDQHRSLHSSKDECLHTSRDECLTQAHQTDNNTSHCDKNLLNIASKQSNSAYKDSGNVSVPVVSYTSSNSDQKCDHPSKNTEHTVKTPAPKLTTVKCCTPGVTRDVLSLKQSNVKPGIPRIHIYDTSVDDVQSAECCHCANTDINTQTMKDCEYYHHLDVNHIIFDLQKVRTIVLDMVKLEEFNDLDLSNFSISPQKLLSMIDEHL